MDGRRLVEILRVSSIVLRTMEMTFLTWERQCLHPPVSTSSKAYMIAVRLAPMLS